MAHRRTRPVQDEAKTEAAEPTPRQRTGRGNRQQSASAGESAQTQEPKLVRKTKKAKKKKKKDEKELSLYVQDFIPLKNIRNGIIETTDNRYIKIVEVEPINFNLRSEEEKNTIIWQYASWLKIANVRLQIKSVTKKADSEKHISIIRGKIREEENRQAKKMGNDYIRLVQTVGSSEALTRRFFIILQYEPYNGNMGSYQEIFMTLQSAAQQVRKYMAGCGNNVIVPKQEDAYLLGILYMLFNRRSSVNEPLASRVKRVTSDWMKNKGLDPKQDEAPFIPPINFVAPRGLDLTHMNYVVMDGLYYTYLYIKGEGYPKNVRAGWMNMLVNSYDGVDVDVHMSKVSKLDVQEKVARQIRLNMVKMKSTNPTQSDYEELEAAIQGGYYIKESMANGEDLVYTTTIITISSETLDQLNMKRREIKNNLRAQDIECYETTFEQEACLKSTMPFLYLDKNIERKGRRNMLTSGAAAGYMFTAFELCDDNGILLGINQQNSSLCIVDIFNSKLYKNANMTIIGTSGSGKTFTMQLMALRMRLSGIQCFIIAPLKGSEFRRACENIGGSYIKISSGSPQCINIMEIRPRQASSEDILDGGETLEESMLAQKTVQLSTFFSLMFPEMSDEEEGLLDEAVQQVYFQKGITLDNSSLYDSKGHLRPMPVLEDLYKILSTNPQARRLSMTLQRYVNGSAACFNKQTNVDLNNRYIVMDISDLKGKMLPIGMFIALDFCWDKIKEDRSKKKALFIDETWQLIGGSSNLYAASFVLEVFKIIRGYGGAAIAATQDLSDFFALEDGKYGRGIINNSKTKIILNLEQDELDTVVDIMRLSRAESRSILQFERGQALIVANNNKIAVTMRPSETEKNMITTDRAEIEAMIRKKQAAISSGLQ